MVQDLARSRGSSASQELYVSQTARKMSFPLSVSGETSPRESYILTSLAKIPLLDRIAISAGPVILNESSFLFHKSPRVLANSPWLVLFLALELETIRARER